MQSPNARFGNMLAELLEGFRIELTNADAS